jgi:hypothetical protein
MPQPLKWLKERFVVDWAGLVRWPKRLKEKLMADPAGPMQWWKGGLLFFYFLIIGGLIVYFVYGLWAAEPKVAQRIPAAEPIYKDDEKPTNGTPKIKLIDPQTVTIGSGQASIRIFGYNFTQESKVRLNDATRSTQYIDEHQLVVSLASSDFATLGVVVVNVVNTVNGDEKRSKAMTLAVEAAGSSIGEWRVFGCPINIRQEPRLILIVLFTGTLGACMYGLKSLADYLGERKLIENWFTFYVIQPPVGAGIAFIFYLVIRGGFLAGTNFDAATVNPFGIAAVAGLVGMFSDKAFAKLREVFLTLFKSDDTRSDTLAKPPLAITTGPKLPDAHAVDRYTQTLSARGGTPPYAWAKGTGFPTWLTLDKDTGQLTGTPPSGSPPTGTQTVRFAVQVADSTGATAVTDLELTVHDP